MKENLGNTLKRASKRREIAINSIEDFSKELNEMLHTSLNDKIKEINLLKDDLSNELNSIKDKYIPLLQNLTFEIEAIRKNVKKAVDELKSEACLRLKVKEEHINLIMKTDESTDTDTGYTTAESINQ